MTEEKDQKDKAVPAEETAALPTEADLLADKQAELDDMKDKLLRVLAEIENTRRRSAIDVQNAKDYAIKDFAKSMLEVCDNLERAVASLPEDAPASFKEGVQMTLDSLIRAMGRFGVKEADGVGTPADVAIDQIISQIETDESPDGVIVQVLQKGYWMKDRPLREAMVVVAKGKNETTEHTESHEQEEK